MELIAWIFGLFSFVGAIWAILRNPSWTGKILGLAAPVVYLIGMWGVSHVLSSGRPIETSFSSNDELNSLLLNMFVFALPLAGGVLGVILCLTSESARTRYRIAEVMKQIRSSEAQAQGPYR